MAHRRYNLCTLTSLERVAQFGKSCVNATSFEEFVVKQRRLELKSVWNSVAKTVLVESANQFSIEEQCRTQYSLTYFLTPCRPSDCPENPKIIFKPKAFLCMTMQWTLFRRYISVLSYRNTDIYFCYSFSLFPVETQDDILTDVFRLVMMTDNLSLIFGETVPVRKWNSFQRTNMHKTVFFTAWQENDL